MATTIIVEERNKFLETLRLLTGYEFESTFRHGQDYDYTVYFKDDSEYRVKTVDGITSSECTGVAAWVYRFGIKIQSWIKNR